jgi:hypothetical protein
MAAEQIPDREISEINDKHSNVKMELFSNTWSHNIQGYILTTKNISKTWL